MMRLLEMLLQYPAVSHLWPPHSLNEQLQVFVSEFTPLLGITGKSFFGRGGSDGNVWECFYHCVVFYCSLWISAAVG